MSYKMETFAALLGLHTPTDIDERDAVRDELHKTSDEDFANRSSALAVEEDQ